MNNFANLSAHIIELSESDTWAGAVPEWEPIWRDMEEQPETCPCGHFPIIEVCHIRNTLNGNETYVGNVCIDKFMDDYGLGRVHRGVQRIRGDESKRMTSEALDWVRGKGWISDGDHALYWEQIGKRRHNARVAAINRLVLTGIEKPPGWMPPDVPEDGRMVADYRIKGGAAMEDLLAHAQRYARAGAESELVVKMVAAVSRFGSSAFMSPKQFRWLRDIANRG